MRTWLLDNNTRTSHHIRGGNYKLTASKKDDLNFLSTFLHNSKQFINPVSSCSRVWGGLMWAIGWRKSYNKDQIFGR
ncbi:hypothetical protein VP01_110g3, partial [Puccinia sorghi]